VQGPSPGRFDYRHWCGGPTGRCGAVVTCGPTGRCGAVVVAVLDRSAGGPVRPEPGLAAGAGWPRLGDCSGRIVRVGGNRQRGGLDGSLGWQLVPRGRDWMVAWGSAVSESEHPVSKVCWTGAWVSAGWPEGSRGTGGCPEARPGPWSS
jgi:hypothetical protein